jgi:hypothetical protein
MVKSKRSSKRSSKKNKNKACRKRGHGAVFCDLAEAGRILWTITAVINFVVCAIILIVSIVAIAKGKAKTAGEAGIAASIIWAAIIGLLWWLVEKYDIISVISIALWLIVHIAGFMFGNKIIAELKKIKSDVV